IYFRNIERVERNCRSPWGTTLKDGGLFKLQSRCRGSRHFFPRCFRRRRILALPQQCLEASMVGPEALSTRSLVVAKLALTAVRTRQRKTREPQSLAGRSCRARVHGLVITADRARLLLP